MTNYISYDLVDFGKPLEKRKQELPQSEGFQVLLCVRRSGVCHSDLHIAEGYFDLGEEGTFSMKERGLKLPLTMGHEIVGEVVATGPQAPETLIGRNMFVFPWISCGKCQA